MGAGGGSLVAADRWSPNIQGAMGRVQGGMRIADKSWAYVLLRVAFGVNFAVHGFIRIYSGIGAFAVTTAEHMAKSPLPHGFVYGFAYVIPVIEALLGVALIFGVLTRVALVLGAVFMMGLTIGVGSNQQWDIAGQQLVYSVIFFLLLFLLEHNALAVDGLRRRD
jgi:thiosulfate dehydrogenase [quinone] large subunit